MSEETKATETTTEPITAEAVAAENKPAETKKVRKSRNTMEMIEKSLLEAQNNSGKFPDFHAGDTVKVFVKIVEGDKTRIQPFEGVVLAIKHGSNRKSFIVRRVSYNVSIERVFPFHSPYIEKIELVRKGRVRRSKLYYLRGRFGRSAVVSEKVS